MLIQVRNLKKAYTVKISFRKVNKRKIMIKKHKAGIFKRKLKRTCYISIS